MFLSKTSVNTIALWMAKDNVDFKIPVIISTGTGIEKFFNIDVPTANITRRQTLNGKIITMTKNVLLTGSVTFHPQSNALYTLRNVLQYQAQHKVEISGTVLIINPGVSIATTFTNFVWNNPYSSANRDRVLSDVTLSYSCSPPTEVSLAGLTTLANSILGQIG